MGKVAGAQNFDGANWYEQHIAKRTRDALAEQDRAFAEKHAGDSLDQLAAYLRRCAGHWGKSPAPIEIVGGSYIAERFGDWKDALRAAHLNPIYKKPRNRGRRSASFPYGQKGLSQPLPPNPLNESTFRLGQIGTQHQL